MVRTGLLAALLCMVPNAFAHKIRVDFDHGANFGSYKTYCVERGADAGSPLPTFPNPLVMNRVGVLIEEALGARGLKRATGSQDLHVTYRIDVREQPSYFTYSDGWGPGWVWGYSPAWPVAFSTTSVQIDYQGTLVVDIIDAKRNKLVFEGTSTQMVSSRPEKNNKKLTKAVCEVFAKYPPR